ncbi:MAG: SagB/ThcOx family dehydrogenase [Candidatus Rokubacteria bacterium]|nr:SagB/ThcOx family dehydrogenase [Candidatus Rokubacteria bacterium]
MSRRPASNADVRVARDFHDETTHSPSSVRTSGHTLDWDVKPLPFKIYADLPPVPLPREVDPLATDTLVALGALPAPATARPTLATLATLLYFSAGITKRRTYPGGGEVLFRAAPSTGALYQTEVYVAAGAVDDLDPGLYHFNPGDFALRQVRAGDVRPVLARAAADDALARRAATLVLTAIYWRNTWKYQARAFRHLFWDSGTMLANVTAVGRVLGLAPAIVTGFVDPDVNRLLGIDPDREATLELVAIGPDRTTDRVADGGPADLVPIAHDVVPLSSREVDYPLVREMYRASSLETPEAVRAWRAAAQRPGVGGDQPRARRIVLPPARSHHGHGLGETIQRRGSTREFSHEPISLAELSTVLAVATRPIPADVGRSLVDVYLVANAVDGLPPGAYWYGPDAHALEEVRLGSFRNESAFLCLEQPLGGDAAAVLYFLSPLDGVLGVHGNRGYRLVNLQAGLAGGRAYLAAYGQGFGASGLTFYDQHVVRFFSPHASGKDAIFVTALGRSRTRVGSEQAIIPVTSRLRRT